MVNHSRNSGLSPWKKKFAVDIIWGVRSVKGKDRDLCYSYNNPTLRYVPNSRHLKFSTNLTFCFRRLTDWANSPHLHFSLICPDMTARHNWVKFFLNAYLTHLRFHEIFIKTLLLWKDMKNTLSEWISDQCIQSRWSKRTLQALKYLYFFFFWAI